MSKIPSKSFSITIDGNTYSSGNITQGKIIDLELNKQVLSRGYYSAMHDITALNVIDADAAILAFFPEVRKDMKVESITEVDLVNSKEILKEMNKFYKWYKEWIDFMSDIEKQEQRQPEEEDGRGEQSS